LLKFTLKTFCYLQFLGVWLLFRRTDWLGSIAWLLLRLCRLGTVSAQALKHVLLHKVVSVEALAALCAFERFDCIMAAQVVEHVAFCLETHAAVLGTLVGPVVVVQAHVHVEHVL